MLEFLRVLHTKQVVVAWLLPCTCIFLFIFPSRRPAAGETVAVVFDKFFSQLAFQNTGSLQKVIRLTKKHTSFCVFFWETHFVNFLRQCVFAIFLTQFTDFWIRKIGAPSSAPWLTLSHVRSRIRSLTCSRWCLSSDLLLPTSWVSWFQAASKISDYHYRNRFISQPFQTKFLWKKNSCTDFISISNYVHLQNLQSFFEDIGKPYTINMVLKKCCSAIYCCFTNFF